MEFVTDRTENDVLTRTKKGFLNYDDMNRIDGNLKTICDSVAVPYTSKTYNTQTLVKVSDFDRLENGLNALDGAYNFVTEPLPARPYNDYKKLNSIESFLEMNYTILKDNRNEQSYAGEFYADEYGLI